MGVRWLYSTVLQGSVESMSKLFVKLRDPISGSKISIPLEVPEGYDFWKISNTLNNVLKSIEWLSTAKTGKSQAKKSK